MVELKLFALGSPHLELEGEGVDLHLRKAVALLVFLAVTKGEHSRDGLATMFWPENDQSSARANLRRTLYQINKTVGVEVIAAEGDSLALGSGIKIWTDVEAFQKAVRDSSSDGGGDGGVHEPQRSHLLEEAVGLYKADFLSGFSLPDSPQFDEWQFFEAENLRGALASTLRQLVAICETRGDLETALQYARHLLSQDQLHEPAHRTLMRLYAKAGQQAAALRQYQECLRVLEDELGVPPQPETDELYHTIHQRREVVVPTPTFSRPEIKYVPSGDVHIAYQVMGEGPVDIMCIFGYVTHMEMQWENPGIASFFENMASFSRVIMFDRRGVGLSDRVGSPPTLDATMDDILAVMGAAGSEHAILFGWLEGGPTGILFTATYPELVSGLVLYGTCAKWTRSEDYPWAITREQYDRWLQHLSENWGEALNIETYAPNHAHDPQLRMWLAKILRHASSPAGMKAVLEVMRDIDVRHILPAIRVPTLVLQRKGDQAIRLHAGRYLSGHIPGAKYVELEGEDHWFFVGDSQSILDEIKIFVEDLGSPEVHGWLLATILIFELMDYKVPAWNIQAYRARDEEVLSAIRQQVSRFRGTEISWNRGRYTVTFDGPSRAIHCARAIFVSLDAKETRMRAGLHTGECERWSGGIRGTAVHIAEAVLGKAGPGEILVSSTVKDLIAGSGFQFVEGEPCRIETVNGQWGTFSVSREL